MTPKKEENLVYFVLAFEIKSAATWHHLFELQISNRFVQYVRLYVVTRYCVLAILLIIWNENLNQTSNTNDLNCFDCFGWLKMTEHKTLTHAQHRSLCSPLENSSRYHRMYLNSKQMQMLWNSSKQLQNIAFSPQIVTSYSIEKNRRLNWFLLSNSVDATMQTNCMQIWNWIMLTHYWKEGNKQQKHKKINKKHGSCWKNVEEWNQSCFIFPC